MPPENTAPPVDTVVADFGQSKFCQSNFGQSIFWPIHVDLVCVVVCCCCVVVVVVVVLCCWCGCGSCWWCGCWFGPPCADGQNRIGPNRFLPWILGTLLGRLRILLAVSRCHHHRSRHRKRGSGSAQGLPSSKLPWASPSSEVPWSSSLAQPVEQRSSSPQETERTWLWPLVENPVRDAAAVVMAGGPEHVVGVAIYDG